jgi:hypothetical protein
MINVMNVAFFHDGHFRNYNSSSTELRVKYGLEHLHVDKIL